ncbi:hypothetical protein OESDEN_09384 [Oesophagostomum dentatum]|uniref:Uncharacterized protein n=1 Tax=Oesophagostomum dentatum TaxID=61180 RepID=A0A0B1T3P1_OESDE|nr:hypothetical protein OESDEN_09384 [Oesophagostomum dentatum]
MVTLLILTFVAAINAKSLTIIPSTSFHGNNGKLASSDFIKESVAVDYQDETAPSGIQPRTSFTMDYTKMNETELYENRTTIFEVGVSFHSFLFYIS